MILAVAGGLATRKGKDYLLKLPSLLNDDEVLVLVGLKMDKKPCCLKRIELLVSSVLKHLMNL